MRQVALGSRMEQSEREYSDIAILPVCRRCVILIASLLCSVVCLSAPMEYEARKSTKERSLDLELVS